jgi:hypothetical protein
MRCQERETLLEKYQQAVDSYSEAVRLMRDYGLFLSFLEFKGLVELTVRAQTVCHDLRGALNRHIEEHCC